MSRDQELAAQQWLDAALEHVAAVSVSQLAPRMRCFHSQRAVEFSLKALLIKAGIQYPHTHALNQLI